MGRDGNGGDGGDRPAIERAAIVDNQPSQRPGAPAGYRDAIALERPPVMSEHRRLAVTQFLDGQLSAGELSQRLTGQINLAQRPPTDETSSRAVEPVPSRPFWFKRRASR